MADMEINVIKLDAKPLSDVANNLIDKLSCAVGWIFTHDTPKRQAIQQYVESIKASDQPDLIKAALIANAKSTLVAYCNQRDIIEIALKNLSDQACPQDIDYEFLSRFMDSAKHVSSEDIKVIWGKILCNECENPGQTPKALIRILGELDSAHAKTFFALGSYVVTLIDGPDDKIPGIYPIVHSSFLDDSELCYWGDPAINYHDLSELCALGLLRLESGNEITAPFNTDKGKIHYFDETLCVSGPLPRRLKIGFVSFTAAGVSLYSAITPKKKENFLTTLDEKLWKLHVTN